MGKYFSNSSADVFAKDGGACSALASSDGTVATELKSRLEQLEAAVSELTSEKGKK